MQLSRNISLSKSSFLAETPSLLTRLIIALSRASDSLLTACLKRNLSLLACAIWYICLTVFFASFRILNLSSLSHLVPSQINHPPRASQYLMSAPHFSKNRFALQTSVSGSFALSPALYRDTLFAIVETSFFGRGGTHRVSLMA